jgi:hypothetical protein
MSNFEEEEEAFLFDPEEVPKKKVKLDETNFEDIIEDKYKKQEKLERRKLKGRKRHYVNLGNPSHNSVLVDFMESEVVQDDEDFTEFTRQKAMETLGIKKLPKLFSNIRELKRNRDPSKNMSLTTAPPPIMAPLHQLISVENLKAAIHEIKKFYEDRQSFELIPTNQYILLLLCFQDLVKSHSKTLYLPLKKSLFDVNGNMTPINNVDICLISGDNQKHSYKALGLKNVKVIKMTKLKKLYHRYIDKIRLMDSYELFFYDKEKLNAIDVFSFLGSKFEKRRKLPYGTTLATFQKDLQMVLSSTRVHVERAAGFVTVRVARCEWNELEIAENVMDFFENSLPNLLLLQSRGRNTALLSSNVVDADTIVNGPDGAKVALEDQHVKKSGERLQLCKVYLKSVKSPSLLLYQTEDIPISSNSTINGEIATGNKTPKSFKAEKDFLKLSK